MPLLRPSLRNSSGGVIASTTATTITPTPTPRISHIYIHSHRCVTIAAAQVVLLRVDLLATMSIDESYVHHECRNILQQHVSVRISNQSSTRCTAAAAGSLRSVFFQLPACLTQLTLCRTAPHRITPHRIAPHRTALHRIAPHCCIEQR